MKNNFRNPAFRNSAFIPPKQPAEMPVLKMEIQFHANGEVRISRPAIWSDEQAVLALSQAQVSILQNKIQQDSMLVGKNPPPPAPAPTPEETKNDGQQTTN